LCAGRSPEDHVRLSFFFLLIARPPTSALFPYTTLFRSRASYSLPIWFSAVRRPRTPAFSNRRTISHPSKLTKSAMRKTKPTSARSEEHTSELQSRFDLVCRLLLEKQNRHEERGGVSRRL